MSRTIHTSLKFHTDWNNPHLNPSSGLVRRQIAGCIYRCQSSGLPENKKKPEEQKRKPIEIRNVSLFEFQAPNFISFFFRLLGGPFKLKNCLATRHSSCPSIFQVASCSCFWALSPWCPESFFFAVATLLFVAALLLFTRFCRPQQQEQHHKATTRTGMTLPLTCNSIQ